MLRSNMFVAEAGNKPIQIHIVELADTILGVIFPILFPILVVVCSVALGVVWLLGIGSVFDVFSHSYDKAISGGDDIEKVSSDNIVSQRMLGEVQKIELLDRHLPYKLTQQMVALIDKCRKVHDGYQKYPNFNYRRSEFYQTDLKLYEEILSTYTEAESLPKDDLEYMVNTLDKKSSYYDDTLEMQKDKLFNRIRVSLDVLRASDH